MDMNQKTSRSVLHVALYQNKQLVQARPLVAKWEGEPVVVVWPWPMALPSTEPIAAPVGVNLAVQLLESTAWPHAAHQSWLIPERARVGCLPTSGSPRDARALGVIRIAPASLPQLPARIPELGLALADLPKLIQEEPTWPDVLAPFDQLLGSELHQGLPVSQALASETGHLTEGEITAYDVTYEMVPEAYIDGLICEIFFGD